MEYSLDLDDTKNHGPKPIELDLVTNSQPATIHANSEPYPNAPTGAKVEASAQGNPQLVLREPGVLPAQAPWAKITPSNLLRVLAGAMLLPIIIISFAGEHTNPIDNLDEFIEGLLVPESPYGATSSANQSPQNNKASQKSSKSKATSKSPAPSALTTTKTVPAVDPLPDYAIPEEGSAEYASTFQNPYWYIPVKLEPSLQTNMQKTLAHRDEEQFLTGLGHVYNYQAFLTVRTIRERHLKGSEPILMDALGHKRFWVRMEALIALCEFEVAVDLDMIESVLGGARQDLIKNYFKRLQVDPSNGFFYVAKQALKLVGPRARLVILKEISRRGWRGHRLFLAAATMDPDPAIKKWVYGQLEQYGLSGRHLRSYKEIAYLEYRKSLTRRNKPEVIEVSGPKDYRRPNSLEIYDESQIKREASYTSKLKEAPSKVSDGFETLNSSEFEIESAKAPVSP